jgi:putative NAD(P)-binding protein
MNRVFHGGIMQCAPTQTPENIDGAALKEKYRQERDKRIRPEGQKQYVRPLGDFADTYESDPHMPVALRAAITEDLDVAILGAGWSGILAGYHLKKAGVSTFRNIDHAGDFGGVWYWNRYPGLQCDNDAYCYLPLLEETRGARVVEPSLKAQDEWVKTIRETGFDISQFQRECTPSYFNNEGDEKKARWFLGESYGPGWDAFQQLMHEWRNKGDLAGLDMELTPKLCDANNPAAARAAAR